MKYEEFVDRITEILGYELISEKFTEKWVIGGMTGGSCWNDGAYMAVTAETEPEFDSLDKVLADICPSISFLSYKKLMKFVVTSESYENEYYGNSTVYAIKSITLQEVYDFLVESKLI